MGKQYARILRDVTGSERLAVLLDTNPFAEALYWRPKAMADDYGRYHGTPQAVATGCCPRNLLRRGFRLAKIGKALAVLEACGCLSFYEVAGRRYLLLTDYFSHAHTRWAHVGRPEYPAPPGWIAPPELVTWLLGSAHLRAIHPERFGVTRDNWPEGGEYPGDASRRGPEAPECPSPGRPGPLSPYNTKTQAHTQTETKTNTRNSSGGLLGATVCPRV